MIRRVLSIWIYTSSIFFSQGLEKTLYNLAGDAAYSYVSPVANAFGSNLNSGWITKIPRAGQNKFTISISLNANASFFKNENSQFALYGNYRLSVESIDKILANSGIEVTNPEYYKYKALLTSVPQKVFLTGPTIIGSKNEELEVHYPGSEIEGVQLKEYKYYVKQVTGYLDELEFLPLASIQFNIGTYCGSVLSIRYLPPVEIQSLGQFTYWGLGFLHNPTGWFNLQDKIDAGVGFYHQKMVVGDLFSSSATQFLVSVGKSFNCFIRITPAVTISYELSKTIISYSYEYRDFVYGVPISVTRPIDVEFSGRNKFSFSTGVMFGFGIFDLRSDYKFAATPTFSTSLIFNVL
ncbi:MAG: hypothetical protein SCALA702_03980 [Melioribacteraceae bacterium]|nr:MAG: hypothetical protein SCALA702_03980 [Melioribacteraceae bacterium]